MAGNKNSGRQPMGQASKDVLYQKMESYLHSGLSVNRACLQAGISPSTVYRLMREDDIFRERITASGNYLSVMMNTMIVRELHRIAGKQRIRAEKEGRGGVITKDDLLNGREYGFIKWFATHSRAMREEFGRGDYSESFYDPSEEIRRVGILIDREAG